MKQNKEIGIVSTALKKIHSSVVTVEPCCFGENIIARTGVFAKMPHMPKPLFFGGYSCQKNQNRAKHVSVYEVAERVLATYYFSNPEYRDTSYPIVSWNDKVIDKINAEEVIVGPTLLNPQNAGNAVGLSFHYNAVHAKKHAVCEWIERALLGSIWYEDHSIVLLEEKQIDGTDLLATSYTVCLDPLIPFVMTVIQNSTLFCVGARFSESFQDSFVRSMNEATMLAHDAMQNKGLDHIVSPLSKIRMHSQKDPPMTKRRSDILKNLTKGRVNKDLSLLRSLSLEESLKILKIKKTDVRFCILHKESSNYLIRAFVSHLKTLPMFREMYSKSDRLLIDPVC